MVLAPSREYPERYRGRHNMPYARPMSRDDVIGRLTTITDVIAEDLADESADRQMTLENVHRYLSTLTRRLKLDADKDSKDANTIAGNLATLVYLATGYTDASSKDCPECGGCPAGQGCIGELILDDHKACTCPPKTAPVAAQTI